MNSIKSRDYARLKLSHAFLPRAQLLRVTRGFTSGERQMTGQMTVPEISSSPSLLSWLHVLRRIPVRVTGRLAN